jgi:hypothetical protein
MSDRKEVDVYVIVVEKYMTKSFGIKNMVFDDKLSLVDVSLQIESKIREMDT